MQNTNCTWICPKCDFFNFSDSFFDEQLNLESENRFNPLGNSDKIDLHEPQIVAIQETKIDSSISSSELFPETFPYSVYRKDRTLDGGGVMLLIHKDIPHIPITELENKSESVWVKVFANKTAQV